jgi:hypothetical protein
MDIKKLKPNFFSTFFMFPFGFENSKIDEISNLLRNSGKWNAENYQIKSGLDYNEYVYFYKSVREILLHMNQHTEVQQEGVQFFKYRIDNDDLKYVVHNPNFESKEKIELPVEDIYLHLFDPGVGILIFEIVSDKNDENFDLSLYDCLAFLTNGRRVFPPFINPHAVSESGKFSEGFVKMDAISAKECAEKISITCGDKSIVEEDFKNNFSLSAFTDGAKIDLLPYLSKIIRHFLDIGNEFNYEKNHYWPIIDDRMFCHTYYSIAENSTTQNRSFFNKLKKALNTDFPISYYDDALQIWYQVLYLDLGGPSCANRPMLLKHIKESSYNRWTGYGTFYGFTRYSSTTISNVQDVEFIYNNFKTMYYQISILLFFYRGALLSFSKKSATIAANIHNLTKRKNNEKETKRRKRKRRKNKKMRYAIDVKKDLNAIRQELEDLNKEFLLFRNKLWFREVTAQEQGIEMFDIMTEKMRNVELLEDLQIEIKELYAYFDAYQEKETAKTINTLTILGAIFIPFAIVTALFGMNFPFQVCKHFQSIDSIIKFAASFAIVLLSSAFFYLWFRIIANRVARTFISRDGFSLPKFWQILFPWGIKNKK